MSAPTNLNPCCSTDVTTQYPGATGATGAAGAAGQPGFTLTTVAVVPFAAAGSSVVVNVASSTWMAIGMYVFVSDGTTKFTFKITAIPTTTSFTGTYQGYSSDSNSGNAAIGSIVTSTGAGQNVQGGQSLLILGVKNVTGVSITSLTPAICVSLITPGGTRTAFAGYQISAPVVGAGTLGSFTITAINDAGATLALCTDIVAWHIIN